MYLIKQRALYKDIEKHSNSTVKTYRFFLYLIIVCSLKNYSVQLSNLQYKVELMGDFLNIQPPLTERYVFHIDILTWLDSDIFHNAVISMNGWTCINPVLTKYREIHVSYIIKMMQNVHKCIFAQTSQWIPNNAHNDIFGEDKVFLRFVGVLFIKQWSVHLQSKHPWIRVCIHATDDLFHLHVFISCILGYSSNPELFLFLVKK